MVFVTLLTDFGTIDGFVGAMKGVILSRAPTATVLDITHDVPAQDVRAGAWVLRQATWTFPKRSIHVAVVDPGVGSIRRAIVMRMGGRLFVGPDNGLFSWVAGAERARAWSLDRHDLFMPSVSSTFHGRDVFASVAGHLAAGVRPEECGPPVHDWVRLSWPAVRRIGSSVIGTVVHVDRFGNLVTNIASSELGDIDMWEVYVGDAHVGSLRHTFADVAPGQWVAYIGSGGTIEVAVRNGSAAQTAAGQAGVTQAHGIGRDAEVRLVCSEGT